MAVELCKISKNDINTYFWHSNNIYSFVLILLAKMTKLIMNANLKQLKEHIFLNYNRVIL